MTVFRNNPLLMTVMGANPGPRRRRPVDDPINHAIGQAWHRLMSGVQVSVMDIPKIFRDVKLEMAAGMSLEEAVMRVGQRFQVNRNPARNGSGDPRYNRGFRAGEKFAVALIYKDPREANRLLDEDVPGYGSAFEKRVILEAERIGRSISTGGSYQRDLFEQGFLDGATKASERPGERYLSNPSLAASLAGGLAGAFVTHAMSNPSGPAFIVIDSATGRVVYTKRATGTGDQAIRACKVVAQRKADEKGRSFIIFMDMGRVRVGDFRSIEMVRAMGITDQVHPAGPDMGAHPTAHDGPASRHNSEFCNKCAHEAYCSVCRSRRNPLTRPEMAEMRDRERFYVGRSQKYEQEGKWPDAAHFRGAAQESRHIRERYHAPGARFEPNPNPGPQGRRKITMTIEQFATWVKRQRNPAMWKAFLAKFRGYEKWTHGAKSRKVTLEWQNVPGVDGLWITYDGGKQPESTYIMPKGSPRKGAWKHPWDTMPDIKHDPEAGVVLTKLRGKSKITDFYHK